MHVKDSGIVKFMKVIYELWKNFTSEHRMSISIILLFKRRKSIAKLRVVKKLLFLDLEIDTFGFKS